MNSTKVSSALLYFTHFGLHIPDLYAYVFKGTFCCTQDELVTALRGDGRKQAAQRMLRQKKDGQLVYDSSGFDTASG